MADSDLSLLIDMGFSEAKALKALNVTGNKGVEAAMEWLLVHGDDVSGDDTSVSEKVPESKDDRDSNDDIENIDDIETVKMLTDADAKCIKCDECNKKFRTDAEVEFHAVKTGHQAFSESTEEIKPLTEEEKKEQIKKVENLIKQRRAEKAEQEKKEALEREKNRRKTGQELTHVRQKLQEEEIKQLAELKRKEKLEAKLARQRVLEEIERDKQARKEKFGMGTTTAAAPVISPPPIQTSVPNETFNECKLQIRLTDGKCLTQTFGPNEELAAVRLYVQMNRTDGDGPFTLMTNFPRKVYGESDMKLSLSKLGLVPSAVLIVTKQV